MQLCNRVDLGPALAQMDMTKRQMSNASRYAKFTTITIRQCKNIESVCKTYQARLYSSKELLFLDGVTPLQVTAVYTVTLDGMG